MYERGLAHNARRNREPARDPDRAQLLQSLVERVFYLGRRPFTLGEIRDDFFDLVQHVRDRAKMEKACDRVFGSGDRAPVKLIRIAISDQLAQLFEMLAAPRRSGRFAR
jgi:hypothetical protein